MKLAFQLSNPHNTKVRSESFAQKGSLGAPRSVRPGVVSALTDDHANSYCSLCFTRLSHFQQTVGIERVLPACKVARLPRVSCGKISIHLQPSYLFLIDGKFSRTARSDASLLSSIPSWDAVCV